MGLEKKIGTPEPASRDNEVPTPETLSAAWAWSWAQDLRGALDGQESDAAGGGGRSSAARARQWSRLES